MAIVAGFDMAAFCVVEDSLVLRVPNKRRRLLLGTDTSK